MGTIGDAPLRVEIAPQTLLRLLADGQLCAAELNCLDGDSRARLRRLCLQSCALASPGARLDPLVSKQICRACGQCDAGRRDRSGVKPIAAEPLRRAVEA